MRGPYVSRCRGEGGGQRRHGTGAFSYGGGENRLGAIAVMGR
jgi:hypothetical protein